MRPSLLDPDALLAEKHASRIVGFSIRTLQAWRSRGTGPSFVRAGRSIRYRRSDLIAWIEANTFPAASAGRAGEGGVR